MPIIQDFAERRFYDLCNRQAAQYLRDQGIEAETVKKLHEGDGNIVDLLKSGQIDLLINTLSSDKRIEREAIRIRRASVEVGVPCLTSLDTARALLLALSARNKGEDFALAAVDEYLVGGEIAESRSGVPEDRPTAFGAFP